MKKRYFIVIAALCMVFFVSSASFAQFRLGDDLAAFKKGETISLDLKGMDIIEVLKTLASKGDMNIVVGANVRGRVTMFLKDVDVREAFELILTANNLASDRRGEVIYVMTQRDYEQLYGEKYGDKKKAKIIQLKYAKAAEITKSLNQIKTKIGKVIVDEGSNTIVIIDAPNALSQAVELVKKLDKPTTTMVFELNYATAADIKDKIDEVLTKGVGTAQIDERTNKILITDLKDRMDEIKRILSEFDTKTQQVLIEAKIIEITLTDQYQLGVDWSTVLEDLESIVKKPVGVRGSFGLADAGELSTGAELIVGNFGAGDYGALLQALKTVGDVNTLSTPRITVLNNEEAKILIGTSEPYATNTVTQSGDVATTGSDLNFLDIGVKLHVTPTINRSGFVTMKIKPEVSSSTENYTYGDPETTVPVVSTTQAETSVMIKDGTTIIIAGLIRDNRSDATSEVPYLADIPLFGFMFKKTNKSVQKKELAIFITPHIISGETDYMEVPEKPPLGEGRFTMPERPAFYRRKPVKLSPGYLREKPDGEKPRMEKKVFVRPSTTDDYYYIIKNRILDNLAISEDDRHVSKGDKVKIFFRLYSGGNLAAEPKVTKSTNIYFSREVINAIRRAAPFPAFPLSIKEFKKDFSLEIVYDPIVRRMGYGEK